jgi:hypothetical protein
MKYFIWVETDYQHDWGSFGIRTSLPSPRSSVPGLRCPGLRSPGLRSPGLRSSLSLLTETSLSLLTETSLSLNASYHKITWQSACSALSTQSG